MSVSELILSGYQLASMQQNAIMQSWVAASCRLGGALSGSLLIASIQRAGKLDAVLRCMEDEYAGVAMSADVRLWVVEPLVSLSESWVGQLYEVLRLSVERKLIADSDVLQSLAHDFRLLRVTMEKHQIAQDRRLTAPIPMFRAPAREGDHDFLYDKKDLLRAHIMPTGISQRGSVEWLAIDVAAVLSERWIERRDLSDRVLQLLRV